MIDWRFWLAVSFFICAMVLIAATSSAQSRSELGGGYNYVPQSFEQHWGKDLPDVLQFYYKHDHANGDWFNREKNCCGGKDCLPARSGTVKWTPDGYRVIMPDGGYAMVPEEKAPPIPEDVSEMRATVCLVRGSFVKQVEQAGKMYYNTMYRIREGCFWSGKPRI